MADSKEATPVLQALGADAAYIDDLFGAWQEDPESVPESWQHFFAGMTFFEQRRCTDDCTRAKHAAAKRARKQSNVANLVAAYRRQGYLLAHTNPLVEPEPSLPVLSLQRWEFEDSDLDAVFETSAVLIGQDQFTLHEIVGLLKETYCGAVGAEYMHIRDRGARAWLQREMETTRNRATLDTAVKLDILSALTDAEVFEKFTHSRYVGQKRFSLEGAEALIPGMQAMVEAAPNLGIEEFVIGMAHRGRLNVLANVVGMSYEMIFSEFEGNYIPETVQGHGDVKYHKGYSSDWKTRNGKQVHLSLTANPSHLEAVDPVVQGRTRAKQRQLDDINERQRVVPLLIHGDAAFAGQGVVAETFNLSQLVGYRTGGTVHLVINNQIGFTTPPEEGRSTANCTDVAKIVEAPIFHVNGDDPEAVVYAVTLALRYRQAFNRDVVVDMICYRRHGHNESDDPAFTQPLLYAKIKDRPSARELYTNQLVGDGVLRQEQADQHAADFRERLEQAHNTAKRGNVEIQVQAFGGLWQGMDGPFAFDPVDTAVSPEILQRVAKAMCSVPADFKLNPKVARILPKRLDAIANGGEIDWAFAELLAFGTLLDEGTPVRLSGQDSGRGTFSQRHAIWQDMQTGEAHIPLNYVSDQQAKFCVYNSSLSEAAVLGFEYGYALSEPRMLILWEAQFGDFVNGAQVIVDQFITGAESKWQRDCGLVLLLPHGYEGQGPEHSNAYLERFLQGCAENNVQVCYPSTPAQYFHLLRRQMKRSIRLPLVVMTPKSALRNKQMVSSVSELTTAQFEEFLPDTFVPDAKRKEGVKRLVFCAGKLYWDLESRRTELGADDVAIVRVEQFYPFNRQKLESIVAPYRAAQQIVWAQEEPQNRGGGSFMRPLLAEMFSQPTQLIHYVGRPASASSAAGSLKRHREEQDQLVNQAIEGA